MKPKIKPKLMWGVFKEGNLQFEPCFTKERAEHTRSYYKSMYVQRVLVTAPPKRRKRK